MEFKVVFSTFKHYERFKSSTCCYRILGKCQPQLGLSVSPKFLQVKSDLSLGCIAGLLQLSSESHH